MSDFKLVKLLDPISIVVQKDEVTLESPDGTLWRLSVDNAGNLITTSL